jgi:hypothetical protein
MVLAVRVWGVKARVSGAVCWVQRAWGVAGRGIILVSGDRVSGFGMWVCPALRTEGLESRCRVSREGERGERAREERGRGGEGEKKEIHTSTHTCTHIHVHKTTRAHINIYIRPHVHTYTCT